MRIHIRHDAQFHYASPAKSIIQLLHMTPRSHEGQHVMQWRIDVDTDCRLRESEDAFGNIQHIFTADGPIESLLIHVEGEVETFGTHSIIRGAIERFPPELYLRDTPLTSTDVPMRAFAEQATQHSADKLGKMHALLLALHQQLALEPNAGPQAAASEAFARSSANDQAFAQIFLACARHLGVPARYVCGYHREATAGGQRGWAEAFVAGLGWVGFDPVHGRCPDDTYVRVAVGLDSLGAAPLRGAHFGGEGQTMDVKIDLQATDAMQRQNQ